jgi:transcriptional regulator with XRE-family HTH domain
VNLHPLKVERELRGWSRARLAETLGVSVQTVMRWEQGQTIPYPHYREQLCSLFGKNTRELGLLPDKREEKQALSTTSIPEFLLIDPAIPLAPGNTGDLQGRENLLKQVKKQLLAESSAPTALQGLPGIGKTALAVALSSDRQVQHRFSDGILWARLGPHPNVPGLLKRWGTLLGTDLTETENVRSREDWGRILQTAIGSRRLLLVIDDAWSGDDALAFLIGGKYCAHLLTTRLPQVAFTFAQEGTITVPELKEADALTLLARFAPQAVQQESQSIQTLINAVNGLPLALVLMGKYLANRIFTEQPHRLSTALTDLHDAEQRLHLGTATSSELSLSTNILPSLQTTIALSDRYLSRQAHATLCALACFPARPASFSEEAALFVSQQPVEALDELWDAGLLGNAGPGRYALHQTIADYAHSLGEDSHASERLVNYMLLYIQEHQHNRAALEQEIPSIGAALLAATRLGMQPALTHFYLALLTSSSHIPDLCPLGTPTPTQWGNAPEEM